MDELESRISHILGDPEQMEKITRLARGFMADGGNNAAPPNPEPGAVPDTELLKRMMHLMGMGSEKEKGERAMLEAIAPYLSDKRRGKMEKALRIAKLVRVARLAMEEREGDA